MSKQNGDWRHAARSARFAPRRETGKLEVEGFGV
jgi:hypothetical protein